MKQHDITKICADSLRNFVKDSHGIKLGASHAHELVAAYFGYKSRAALLADAQYPLSNLGQAQIIVMTSDSFIDQRRTELEGLPPDLPDSYTLGEAVYVPLFADKYWGSSPFPPFRSFEKLARHMVENDENFRESLEILRQGNTILHHIFDMKSEDAGVFLNIWQAHQVADHKFRLVAKTLIRLSRVAGHIGYSGARVSFETLHPSEQKIIERRSGVSQ